jgi:8-oxo-dGTP pyrophosphatase MutT (NUDIX family)
MTRTELVNLLEDYRRRDPSRSECAERMMDLAGQWPRCFSRGFFNPGHFTGSAWVIDPETGMVLLTHHRRLDAWLQLGGHGEGETDIFSIAVREAQEESGLPPGVLSLAAREIFDIDIHRIPPGKGEPSHEHFDLRFLFHADSSAPFAVSDESHDLAWVPLSRLEEYSREESLLRMRDRTPLEIRR